MQDAGNQEIREQGIRVENGCQITTEARRTLSFYCFLCALRASVVNIVGFAVQARL